jgi:hypothetical protein
LSLAFWTVPADPSAAKGEGPVHLTVAFGSVWVGLGTGEVREYDEATGRLLAHHLRERAPTGFVHGLVAAAGAVWVAAGTQVVRLDPNSRRVTAVPRSGSAFALAAGRGSVWALDESRVLRISAKAGRRIGAVRSTGRFWGVGAGPAGVVVAWIPGRGPITGPAGLRYLQRVHLGSGRLAAPARAVRCDQAIAVGRESVFTVDQCTHRVARRDPTTLRVLRATVLSRVNFARPVLAFRSLWLAVRGRVLRLDPQTLRTTGAVDIRANVVAAGTRLLWALDTGDGRTGTLRRVHPTTMRPVGRAIQIAP